MPAIAMKQESDPKVDILKGLGDISHIDVADCHVIVATYKRPEKTQGGIVLPPKNLEEDLYQSKEALVIAVGHGATYNGRPVMLHDWIVFKPSDAWAFEIIRPGQAVHCRLVYDKHIRFTVTHPGAIW